ncbi:ADP-ribosylglycohydrolase family protein [Amycolatopsis rhizosphaerae]|uniref:ADP-ribosylglycohydrolase family protein n=1 Tax=Amycolatopsis rhizosphaerae TaxID=2053003 RepID=A0A558D753_9PSEU|nr:ADP-ribosylglycohydrolase family protein [Amycolatopsis rhizosphaerae]TVT56821.1 ADP-ribosylglycohydrolase family protein [Amycolatopsis rhizosphaerae]
MAGDHWISDNDLATLKRLLEGQKKVDSGPWPLTPPVSVHRVELFIGLDSDGKRFLTRNPVEPPEDSLFAPSVGAASTTVRSSGNFLDAPGPAQPPAAPPPSEVPAVPAGPVVTGPIQPHRWRGSVLAGAVADALGAPIENDTIERIRERTTPAGLVDFIPAYDGIGTITDDTQMTLFTCDAMIRANIARRTGRPSDVHHELQLAYQRWLHTQGTSWERARGPRETSERPGGWLLDHRELFHRRAPGATCFFALKEYARTGERATFTHTVNNSKGCGGVMRAAPVALWSEDPAEVFAVGAASAALTHSHPSGYLPAGAFAVIVGQLVRGGELGAAIDLARHLLRGWDGHEETVACLEQALRLAEQGPPTPEKVASLGGGNVGETALAIGVYSVLSTQDLSSAQLVAINHNGDSDSTGSIAGNIAGAIYGEQALHRPWLDRLELREVISTMADDALTEFGPSPRSDDQWLQRYAIPR